MSQAEHISTAGVRSEWTPNPPPQMHTDVIEKVLIQAQTDALNEITYLDSPQQRMCASDAGFFVDEWRRLYSPARTSFVRALDETCLWEMFDIFMWAVLYENKFQLETLHGDFGPLPTSWKSCMALWLHVNPQRMHYWICDGRREHKQNVAPLARVKSIGSALSIEAGAARIISRNWRRRVDIFNQMLRNMSLEISTAVAKIEEEVTGVKSQRNTHRDSICSILQREYQQKYPVPFDMPDLIIPEEVSTDLPMWEALTTDS